ncbi:MAG: glycosyltransferase [Candidatus Nealsonbacteria bacterium]|nr:glycosyltransferase [Candidatus Nealsonbacteria bacterium]
MTIGETTRQRRSGSAAPRRRRRPSSTLPRVMQMLVGEYDGGAENFFDKLAVSLHQAGLPQKLIIGANDNRAAWLRQAGCDVVQLRFGGLRDPISRWRLHRHVVRFRPQAVVVWMNRAARRLPRGNFVKIGRFGGYYPVKYYRRCDYLIGNTPDLVEHIVRSGWPPDRATMLTNFGDLTMLPPADRTELDTPADAPLLLSLGQLQGGKGFDVLLQALVSIPKAYLWLAGDGPLHAELRTLADDLGVADRVRFLGWRRDQSALYRAADVCVVTSRREALSNCTLEAWLHGLPVVATASEGPRWLIDHERTGLLVPIDDVSGLAAAVHRVLADGDLRRRIADGGKQKYDRLFSRRAITRQYVEFFQQITANRAERTA